MYASGAYETGTLYAAGGGVYPGLSDSLGLMGTSPQNASPVVGDGGVIAGSQGSSPATGFGNPITGALIFLALVFVIMLLVHRFGKGDENFRSIMPSAYNAMIIGLAAAATIPLYKAGFGVLANARVPGMGPVFAYISAA